ncbi:MMPL family transporter [Streptomyces beigongshangae]|uniref:MMPL family transporter n=1 Tax=Streptomyces beigongshangae TaxID=2841597 RepID=UPI001C8544FB|nr:MMPL family transporter [Streptomyces sp. REN17]
MPLLGQLARWSFRHRGTVLGAVVGLVVLLAALGLGAGGEWSNGGYTAEGTAAQRAESAARQFGAGTPDLVLYIRTVRPVDSPEVAAQGRRLTQLAAATPAVGAAVSYWNTGRDLLRSDDRRGALLLVDLEGDESRAAHTARALVPDLRAAAPELDLAVSGPAWVNVTATEQAERDLVRSELFVLPVTFLVLALSFRSFSATLVPAAIGATAALGALAVLAVATRLLPISVFAVNLSCALGFGLAVDYALFALARYQEERARGLDAEQAVGRAMSTTGRTVVFCALTMAWCMAGLLVFPLGLIRSFAIASLIVVGFCAVGTLLLLPALVAALGGRLDGTHPQRRGLWRRGSGDLSVSPAWRRVAVAVTARPWVWGTAGAMLLIGLTLSVAGLRPALTDESILPSTAEARTAAAAVRADFSFAPERELTVVLAQADAASQTAELDAYARTLATLPGAARVSTAAGEYARGRRVAEGRTGADPRTGTLVTVFSADPVQSSGTASLVTAVRATPTPGLGPALVTGKAAHLADTRQAVTDALPWWTGLTLCGVFIMLLLFTRSPLVALKAAVLGALSIGAALGLMVLLFQRLQVLGPPSTGGASVLEITMPLLAAALAFGLCVDYEVFLVSRMAEQWRRTGQNTTAIVFGIEHTGRLFTAAALVVAVSMGALMLSQISLLLVLGATMAAIVLIDATVVRGVLVPAFMQLAGRANWWSPTMPGRAAATAPAAPAEAPNR